MVYFYFIVYLSTLVEEAEVDEVFTPLSADSVVAAALFDASEDFPAVFEATIF